MTNFIFLYFFSEEKNTVDICGWNLKKNALQELFLRRPSDLCRTGRTPRKIDRTRDHKAGLRTPLIRCTPAVKKTDREPFEKPCWEIVGLTFTSNPVFRSRTSKSFCRAFFDWKVQLYPRMRQCDPAVFFHWFANVNEREPPSIRKVSAARSADKRPPPGRSSFSSVTSGHFSGMPRNRYNLSNRV